MKTLGFVSAAILALILAGCAEKQAAVEQLELEMAAAQGFPSGGDSLSPETDDQVQDTGETQRLAEDPDMSQDSEDFMQEPEENEPDLTAQLEQDAERLLAEDGDETTLVTDLASEELPPQRETLSSQEAVSVLPDPNRVPDQVDQPQTENISGGTGAYTVQIASTPSSGYARELVDKYTVEGYLPYVSEVNVNGRIVYRVRIGHLASQLEADRLQSELATRYGIEGWIDRIR